MCSGALQMPLAIIVPEMMMLARSKRAISIVKMEKTSFKLPKFFVKMIIQGYPTIFFEFNVSQIAITVKKFPSTIDDFLNS